MKNALGTGVALDHAVVIVIGMLGQGFYRDEIAGINREHWGKRVAEVPPVNRLVIGQQMMVLPCPARIR